MEGNRVLSKLCFLCATCCVCQGAQVGGVLALLARCASCHQLTMPAIVFFFFFLLLLSLQTTTTTTNSVIPQVIPFCIVNGIWAGVLYELKTRQILDITSAPSGHKYLAVIMSFLLVSRVKIVYDRYMHSASSLHACYMAARETVQWMVAMTKTNQQESAKQWRHDVAYAVIVLLRVTMAVLDFQSNPDQIPWALSDVNDEHSADIQGNMFLSIFRLTPGSGESDDDDDDALRPPPPVQQQQRQRSAQASLAHTRDDERVMLEEACRAPVVLAYNVRKEILKQRDGTWLTLTGPQKVWHHPCNEEMRLLDYVGDFLHNFHNIRKLILTPLPFPLVNMNKIFLFLWVFTVPFAICHFDFHLGTIVPVTMVFLITFGFVGLEYVSMELSDPFGDDVRDKNTPIVFVFTY